MADTPRPQTTIGDLMSTHMVSAGPDDPVSAAAAAMIRQKTGSALIMQGSFLAGILT